MTINVSASPEVTKPLIALTGWVGEVKHYPLGLAFLRLRSRCLVPAEEVISGRLAYGEQCGQAR